MPTNTNQKLKPKTHQIKEHQKNKRKRKIEAPSKTPETKKPQRRT